MTDSPFTLPRRHGTELSLARTPRTDWTGADGRYLPSAQVVEELVRLGPDLTKLADDLRSCLSEPD